MRAPVFPRVRTLLARLSRSGRTRGRHELPRSPALTAAPVELPPVRPAGRRPTAAAEEVLRGILLAYRESGDSLPPAFERHLRRRAPHLLDEIL